MAFCSAETCLTKTTLYQNFSLVIHGSNLPQLYAQFTGVHLRKLKLAHSIITIENRIRVDGNYFVHEGLKKTHTVISTNHETTCMLLNSNAEQSVLYGYIFFNNW
jgi:hypothetical protein